MKKLGTTKEQFWRNVLQRCEESGLSQAEFCKRENLNPNNLSHWKREITLRDARRISSKAKREPSMDSRLNYWRSVVADFNISGLSKDDFCKREKIKPAAFTWWRAELIRKDTTKRSDVAPPVDIFLPLSVSAELKTGSALNRRQPIAEIDLVSGTVRLFDSANKETLVTLFRALREAHN